MTRNDSNQAVRSETLGQSASIDGRQAELLRRYQPLVRRIALSIARKLPKNVLADDLIAAGTLGLWDAIRRHSGQDDCRFEWYVRVRIRGAIGDELRAADWLPRRARARAEAAGETAATIVRFEDMGEVEQERALSSNDTAIETVVEERRQGDRVTRALKELPERELLILRRRYFEGVELERVGAELGVTAARVCQLHTRAVERLRKSIDAA